MRRNENVMSVSTMLTIALSIVAMMTMSIILMASVDYAKEFGDEFGGPGVVIYDNTNPIDHSLIDMGPRSANNDAYVLHFINDGGPGMKVQSNALGSPVVYNDGGPGFMVSGLSGTENVHVDRGPIAYDKAVDPSDFLKLMNMKPGDFTFVGGTIADKLGR